MPDTPTTRRPEVALFIRTYSRYGGVELFCHRFHEYLRARGVPVRVLCGEVAPGMPSMPDMPDMADKADKAVSPNRPDTPDTQVRPATPQDGDDRQHDADGQAVADRQGNTPWPDDAIRLADPDAAPLAVDIRVLGLWRPGRFMKNLGLHFAAARALRELPPTTVTVSFGNMAGCHIHRSGGPHRDFMRRSLAAQRSPLRRFTKALSRLLNPNNLLMTVLDKGIYTHPATRRIIAISQNVRTAVARQFPHSPATVVVIPNGVDKRRFNPQRFADLRGEARRVVGLLERHRALGFCSSNFELKGLDRLIAALAHLPEEYVLVVAGGRRSRKYADYAQSLGVEKRVVFLGKVGAADMPRFYAGLDVFCHPSFYDTFGNVVAEAQAMGVPTVTTRATGACDLIDDGRTGRVLDDPEPWALANAVFDLRDIAAGADFGCVEDDAQVFARYLEVIEAVRAELAAAGKS
ncbi:glycosyltransferase family 4 protein [Nitratidesulfovibrio sp. HK-II]|uniref:glycosyltransferase family 4 protein n=1 Tax=Nitratidesulfovibrio sp. HK-II TaxID=2009266 RepID=UPI000E2E52D1|nr:glycosyltransferase family 4 protein [Nitratidesulfovibrio sp. HK-II]GBO95265.1 glycosyl transferase [Nitratidesulfovibrio sp. HK-II]